MAYFVGSFIRFALERTKQTHPDGIFPGRRRVHGLSTVGGEEAARRGHELYRWTLLEGVFAVWCRYWGLGSSLSSRCVRLSGEVVGECEMAGRTRA